MNKKKKVVIAIGASLALIVGAVGAIAAFGFTDKPEYASLQANPDSSIGGTVAYLAPHNQDTCVYLVVASGGDAREVACHASSPEALYFTTEGKLVVVKTNYTSAERDVLVYDPQSLKEVERFSINGPVSLSDASSPSSDVLFTNTFDYDYSSSIFFGGDSEAAHTAWVAKDEDGKDRILTRHAPGDYDFYDAKYSPDKRWILVTDSYGDLLIGDAGNDIRCLVCTTDDKRLDDGRGDFGFISGLGFSQIAWFQQGHTENTVNLEDLKNTSRNTFPLAPQNDLTITTQTFGL